MENSIELNGRTFTKEQIKSILSSRKVINAPGKYQVKARQVTFWQPEDGPARYIINLQATTPYYIGVAKEAIKDEDYQKALNTNMTYTVFVNEGGNSGYLPSSGEDVHIVVSNHTTKDGERALIVSSLNAMPLSEANDASNAFDSLFEEADDFTKVNKKVKEEVE
jgi:hypothetical protein